MKLVKNTFDLFTKPFLKVFEYLKDTDFSISALFTYSISKIKTEYKSLVLKLKNLKQTNFDLGVYHYENGHVKDSAVRFHILRIFFSDIPNEVSYYIGRSYFEQGKLKKAKSYLEKFLSTNPSKFKNEAEYTLKILNDDTKQIKNIPDSIIAHQFNLLAFLYNDIYIIDNHDCIQNFVLQNIKQNLSDLGKPFGNKLLDLGCGTGYIGKKLKDSKTVSQITGIDLSKKMLKVAESLKSDDLKVYDKTINENCISYLKSSKDKFDIIVASQTLNHHYDWNNLLDLCINSLNKNGIFAFTFKVFGKKEGSSFNRFQEEFLHSGEQIMHELKKKKGVSLLLSKPISFEFENDSGLIILKKK